MFKLPIKVYALYALLLNKLIFSKGSVERYGIFQFFSDPPPLKTGKSMIKNVLNRRNSCKNQAWFQKLENKTAVPQKNWKIPFFIFLNPSPIVIDL